MRDALRPFSPAEREKVVEVAEEVSVWRGRLVRYFLWQGLHPATLYDSERFHTRVEGGRLVWNRPKNKRSMDMPLSGQVGPWLPQFLAEPRPRSRQRYDQMLRELEPACGFPTNFLRFRHTCAVYLRRDLGLPPEDVCRLLGMTMQTLIIYVERPIDQIEGEMRAKGW